MIKSSYRTLRGVERRLGRNYCALLHSTTHNTRPTLRHLSQVRSGQARFSFLVSREMFGNPSVRDRHGKTVFYRGFDSKAAQVSFFISGGWRGDNSMNE